MIPARHSGFGLIEMTLVVTVIGICALFAIPRFEAHGEAPRTRAAVKFGREVVLRQNARAHQSIDFAQYMEQLELIREVPQGFHIAEMEAEGQRHWRIVLERLAGEGSFGSYQLVFDRAGFNPISSTVPKGLLPDAQRSMMR